VGRRRRGDRVLAAGVREQAVPSHAGRARRARGGEHRAHGHRDADPRHVPLLARRDGGMTAMSITFDDYLALTQLYTDYAIAVDSGQWDLWPEFFTDDCVYRLQQRENFERGFPLATLSF